MADYDKCYVMTAGLRDEIIEELKNRRTRRVLKTLQAMEACYPTGK